MLLLWLLLALWMAGTPVPQGRAESGVTLVLNMGAVEAQQLLPSVERLVQQQRQGRRRQRGGVAIGTPPLRPLGRVGERNPLRGVGGRSDAPLRDVLPAGVPAVDVDRIYDLDEYGHADG